MSQPRKRVLAFLAVLAGLTGLAQWHELPGLLNGALGLEWADGPIEFVRDNTEHLVVLAALTLFFEFIGIERNAEDSRRREAHLAELLDAALTSSPNGALIEYSLRREHGEQSAVDLTRHLLGDGDTLKEFFVSFRVERDDRGEHTVMAYRYQATVRRYIVAMTTASLVAETMSIARCVTETFVVPPEKARLPPNSKGSPVTITAVARGERQGHVRAELTFRALPERRQRTLLRESGISQHIQNCRLYEANPTQDLKLRGDSIDVDYAVTFETQEDLPYAFWVNDRPLHFRGVEIDLSAIGPDRYDRAQVHLFVGAVAWADTVKNDKGRWLFPIDSWLLAGQGVVVVWPEAQVV